MFDEQIFKSPVARIADDAKVVFVSDMFVEDYVGGAELTSQALIDSSPVKVQKLHTRDLTLQTLEQGADKFWIFGNFADINPQLIPSIVANLKYTVLEYDYKYCRFRSPEKHFDATKTPCDCHNQNNGKLVSAFYYGSLGLWWMSEKQKERYHAVFPFLAEKDNVVLSSVFSPETLGLIEKLRANAPAERKGWIVLGSNSWVKGAGAAEKWCMDNGKDYHVVWNVPYHELLEQLSKAEGFVYLPNGADTCPRMVIEAKLLGCKLHLNDHVQHKDEEWFNTDDLESIKDYLFAARAMFWNGVKHMMDYKPTISGYMTVYNCVTQKYPWKEAILSMAEFCDEICVVDGGSTDGTWQALQFLASTDPILKVKQVPRDWSHPRHAVFDGMQKAEARAMCTSEYCWQMDSDEIVHEDDAAKVIDLCRKIPREADVLSLPVIEYWGGPEKVRVDIQPWKWRLSRNKPNITHGIPRELRTTDADGHPMALPGTDGCDMIDKETGERLPHVSFYTPDVERVRQFAIMGDNNALLQYQLWFNAAVNRLPCVFHYSWYDLPRKIRLYRDYWQNHWNGLWGRDTSDVAENNMMFDVPWSQVTDEMIEARAKELKDKLGGWIWHRKWDGKVKIPHISVARTQPKVMLK